MQFFDIVNFYRRFIKHFNKIVEFFIVMLKKSQKLRKNNNIRKRKRNQNRNRNKLSNIHIFLIREILKIFKRFRKTFIETFVLRHFDFERIIRIEIDAFDKIIEIILCQQNDANH
jgi:spermidine synthase